MNVEIEWAPEPPRYHGGGQVTNVFASGEFLKNVASEVGGRAGWLQFSEGRHNLPEFVVPVISRDGPLGEVWNSIGYFGSPGGFFPSQLFTGEKAANALAAVEEFIFDNGGIASFTIMNGIDRHHSLQEERCLSTGHWLMTPRRAQVTQLDVFCDAASLLESLPSSRRRNIRKAQREGVKVRFSRSATDIAFLADVHRSNMQEVGGVSKRREFFERLWLGADSDRWLLAIGELNGDPVSALLVAINGDTVEYFTPAVLREWRSIQAMVLVDFTVLTWAIQHGFKSWNWGGTHSDQQGLYRFKAQWLAREVPYHYLTLPVHPLLNYSSTKEYLSKYPYMFIHPLKEETE